MLLTNQLSKSESLTFFIVIYKKYLIFYSLIYWILSLMFFCVNAFFKINQKVFQ